MDDLLSETLRILRALVANDSQNPPRNCESIVDVIAANVPERAQLTVNDLGDGCLNVLLERGGASRLFNAHLDTVPASDAWRRDPFRLEVTAAHAIGLGACDIKGGAAAMLAAANATSADFSLLFTTDEEAGSGRCVSTFLATARPYEAVIVAEPTRCRAVFAHRGVTTAKGVFSGTPGHSSSGRAHRESAVHEAIRWSSRALDHAKKWEEHGGLHLNLGRIEGGEKPNMIAGRCEVRFGLRPPPGVDPIAARAELFALADASRASFTPGFVGQPLPAVGVSVDDARALAAHLRLPLGEPVDFWTEAALFSAAGFPALVYGPGDIAEAHTAGEWVRLAELAEAASTYRRLFEMPGGAS